MGKNVHYTIPRFIEGRLAAHRNVKAWSRSDFENYISYSVSRERPGTNMKVILSDQYLFTEFDFYEMESLVSAGDFILVARPEAGFTRASRLLAAERSVGLGKYADMYSALNYGVVWGREPISDGSDL
jgi:hypothetical protein